MSGNGMVRRHLNICTRLWMWCWYAACLSPKGRRSALLSLWFSSGQLLPSLILYLPLLEWLLATFLVAWPWLAQQPEMELGRLVVSQLRMSLCLLMIVGTIWYWLLPTGQKNEIFSLIRSWVGSLESQSVSQISSPSWILSESDRVLVAGFTMRESTRNLAKGWDSIETESPQISIEEINGSYRIDLRGEFHLNVKKGSTFWLRIPQGEAKRTGDYLPATVRDKPNSAKRTSNAG